MAAGANTGLRYAYDRTPDTSITEVASYCKRDPGMKDFVKAVLAHKDATIANVAAGAAKKKFHLVL